MELNKVGYHPKPVVFWSVIEMCYFANGEVYGRVLFTGSEEECDRWIVPKMREQFMHFELPAHFRTCGKLVSVALNVIATTKPCTIFKQGIGNLIGKS